MKKVLFQYEDGDGNVCQKFLIEEQAELWYKFISELCLFAHKRNMNPKWNNLKWEEVKVPIKNKRKPITKGKV